MNLIIIFCFIGFAHWLSHILQCEKCHETLARNSIFLLEGGTHIFGWPIQLMSYLVEMIHSPKTGLTREEVEKTAREAVSRLFKVGGAIEVKKLPGESDEALVERIKKKVGETI